MSKAYPKYSPIFQCVFPGQSQRHVASLEVVGSCETNFCLVTDLGGEGGGGSEQGRRSRKWGGGGGGRREREDGTLWCTDVKQSATLALDKIEEASQSTTYEQKYKMDTHRLP